MITSGQAKIISQWDWSHLAIWVCWWCEGKDGDGVFLWILYFVKNLKPPAVAAKNSCYWKSQSGMDYFS